MKNLKEIGLALTLTLVFLFLLTTPAKCQPPKLPMLVYGYVLIDGVTAPAGMNVSARIGGAVIDSDLTDATGWYGSLSIPVWNGTWGYEYQTVFFYVEAIGPLHNETVRVTPPLLINLTITIAPPVVEITYPEDGGYVDTVPIIWINGTVAETDMGSNLPMINDTAAFDLHHFDNTTGEFAFWNISYIPDGIHSYMVNFTDTDGYTGNDTVTFTIDTVYPIVDITFPTDDYYFDSDPIIWINGTVTETNIDSLQPMVNDTRFTLDLPSWDGAHFAFHNTSYIPDCTHCVRVNFTDMAGKTGEDVVYFHVDTTYPELNITFPEDDYYFDSENVIWINGTFKEKNFDHTLFEINRTEFALDYWIWSPSTHEGTFAFKNISMVEDCNYYVNITLTDLAGKSTSEVVYFHVDATPPAITIEYPENDYYFDSENVIWINGTFVEKSFNTTALLSINSADFALVDWTWNATSWEGTFAFKNSSALADDTYYIMISTTDLAGKTGNATITFTVDTVYPIVDITYPLDDHYFDGESVYWINGTFTEKNINLTEPLVINHTGFILAEWTWNETTYEGTFAFRNDTVIEDCHYYVNVTLTDLAGKSASDVVYFHIDTTHPIVIIDFPEDDHYFDSENVIWINGTFVEKNFNLTGLLSINRTDFTLVDWTWNDTTYEGTFAFWNTTALADGTYYVMVNLTDLAGKTGNATVKFTVDTIHPVVEITYPMNGTYLDSVSVIWINGTVTELNIGALEPAINDTSFDLYYWNPTTGAFAFKNISYISDCTHFYEINFTDLAGKTGYDTVYFTVDTTLPNVEITTPTEDHYFDSDPIIWINGTFVEKNFNLTGLLAINSTDFMLANWTWNAITHEGTFAFMNSSALIDGTYYVMVNLTDLAGKTGEAVVRFHVDTVYPEVEISFPENGYYFDSDASLIWINGTVTETNIDSLQPMINDTRFTLDLPSWDGTNFAFHNTSYIPDDTYYVRVNFTDMAGKTGEAVVYFHVDTVYPEVNITFPIDDYYFDSEPIIWINGTFVEKNFHGLGLQINGTFELDTLTWNSTTYEGTFAFKNSSALADGTYYINVSITDLAGKTGEAVVRFHVDTVWPVVEITSPTTGSPVSTYPGVNIRVNYTYTELNPKNATIKIHNATHIIGHYAPLLAPGVAVTRSDLVYISAWAAKGNYTVTITLYDMAEKNGTDTEADAVIVERVQFIIEFVEGWNLIGMPLEPANATIEAIFAENLTKVLAIYGYNQTWSQWISPGVGGLTELHAGWGYWVLTDAAFNQTIVGTVPEEAPPLVKEWNLIGIIGLDPVPTVDYLAGSNWTVVYGYMEETGTWTYYLRGIGGALTTLQPGEGYWVYIDPPATKETASTSTRFTSNSTTEWNPQTMPYITRRTKAKIPYR